jgi:hypothetical protein
MSIEPSCRSDISHFCHPPSAVRRHVLRADPAGSLGLILLCRLRRDGVQTRAPLLPTYRERRRKAVKPAAAIPERPGSSAPKAHDPLKRGFTPDAGRL